MDRRSEVWSVAASELSHWSGVQREKFCRDVVTLYDKTQEVVCPVVVSFADHLLQGIEEQKDKVVFAARDALSYFIAAQELRRKFPTHYEQFAGDNIIYAYLTRAVAYQNAGDLSDYLKSIGIRRGDNVVVADIGMYGTMVHPISRALSGVHIRFEYLISRNRNIPGYIDDDVIRKMACFSSIIGNPAVHFMEDTFSGLIKSPQRLIRIGDSYVVPDIQCEEYPPEIAIKRELALYAVSDYVRYQLADPEKIDLRSARRNLDSFLSHLGNYRNLMVPHER